MDNVVLFETTQGYYGIYDTVSELLYDRVAGKYTILTIYYTRIIIRYGINPIKICVLKDVKQIA